MFHSLFAPLLSSRRLDRLSELAAIGEQVSAASLLLYPGLGARDASREVRELERAAADIRRRLEARLARAGVHLIDPRLICEAASEMVRIIRLIARIVDCREWLRLETAPAEALELEAVAARGVQLVAEFARKYATFRGSPVEPEGADLIKRRAGELYHRGVARAFGGFPDPLDVLRQKTLYDALLGIVAGSDRALESLRNASSD